MRSSAALSWSLFFLYAVWAAALQALLASPRALGAWTPDLGLVLLFAWAGRFPHGRGPIAALLVALARAAFGADPPVALAAGTLGALGLFAALRAGLEVDRALPRAALCGLCAYLAAALLVSARSLALAAQAPAIRLESAELWPLALASALACLCLAPLALHLPGLSPLRRLRP